MRNAIQFVALEKNHPLLNQDRMNGFFSFSKYIRITRIVCLAIGMLAIPNKASPSRFSDLGGEAFALSSLNCSHTDPWIAVNCPSRIGLTSYSIVSITYYNRYLLKDISTKAISTAIPFQKDKAIGISYALFGTKEFNESKATIAYGQKLFHWLYAGMNLSMFRSKFEMAETGYLLMGGSFGISFLPSEKINITAQWKNPATKAIYDHNNMDIDEELDVIVNLIEKDEYMLGGSFSYDKSASKYVFTLSGQLYFIKNFVLMGSINLIDRLDYRYGVGYLYKNLGIQLGFSNHQALGLSSVASISYTLKNNAP